MARPDNIQKKIARNILDTFFVVVVKSLYNIQKKIARDVGETIYVVGYPFETTFKRK